MSLIGHPHQGSIINRTRGFKNRAHLYDHPPRCVLGYTCFDHIVAHNNVYSLNCTFRPFERTITLQKDSVGHVGFVFKENKITSIVKDSSSARNGVLIDHHMVEVNGQNVVGLKVNTENTCRNVVYLPSQSSH